MTNRRKLAKELAKKTNDAYSFDRYGSERWEACAFMLLGRGHNAQEVEAILRSKWMRWAGDASRNAYGRINSADLKRFIDNPRNFRGGDADYRAQVAQLVKETF